ncbi:Multidrug resistance protein MdtB [compost metagenome]
MNLPGFSITRHVLAACLSLVILLCGLIGYLRIGVDRMPNVDFPVLSVVTPVRGAAPDTVAKTVSQVLESSLNTIAGIDELSSNSSQGVSIVTVRFVDSKNMQEAFTDVQTKVQEAMRQLPDDADTPTISKFDMGAEPVLWLTLSGDVGIDKLTRKAVDVRRALETVSGVGKVEVAGGLSRVMRITVDEGKLAAQGLTFGDISAAFQRHHVQGAGGKVKTEGRDFQVKVDFEFADTKALEQLPLALRSGIPTRLADVAAVDYAPEDSRSFARYQGVRSVALGVVKVSGSNSVAVIDNVRERIAATIAPSLGGQYTLQVASDEGRPIREVVGALQDHLLEGTLLTALVVWLFLKSVRATLIVATAIPVSLAGAVAAMYFAGYTFNTFTLLAMLLLIGVVVDDAIVVLEAIFHQRETNPALTMADAARRGSRLVMFAVMAATLTLVCIFAPVIFMDGTLGKFFKSFAVVVTLGVLVSWFVSMTLTPMLASRYLKVKTGDAEGPVARRLERGLKGMERGYQATLSWTLAHRKTVLLLAALSLVPAVGLLGSVKKGFTPDANDGRIALSVEFAAGIPAASLNQKMDQLEGLIRSEADVDGILSTFREAGASGSEKASISVTMKPGTQARQPNLMAALEAKVSTVQGVKTIVSRGGAGGGGGGSLRFALSGPDYADLVRAAKAMEATLRAVPGMQSLKTDANAGAPQATLKVDRAAAARLGVSAADIAAAVSSMTGATTLGKYTDTDGERYDVVLRSSSADRMPSPDALTRTYVRGVDNQLVRLSEVVDIEIVGAARSVSRLSQQYAVSFSGSPTIPLGDAVAHIEAASQSLPAGMEISYSGQTKEFKKIGATLGTTLAIAVIMLYFVLAAQFNSYSQPFLVMLAQPLAVIGGIGGLWATGHSLNIYSMIGLILLLGLVAKNSILLVDRANQLRDEGCAPHEAIAQACPERLRPVLMTSLTVILTMLPAAFGLGAGAENNAPLAVAIIGGMVSSTLLTLVVVPAAYSLFVRQRRAVMA